MYSVRHTSVRDHSRSTRCLWGERLPLLSSPRSEAETHWEDCVSYRDVRENMISSIKVRLPEKI